MCQICVDSLNELFPEFTWEQKDDVLWSLTAFPFAHGEHIREQLLHVKKIGLEAAYKELDEELERVSQIARDGHR